MANQTSISPPLGFPLFGWTEDRIKQYVNDKPLKVGDQMIIYNGQAGTHHYILALVENPALGRQKRVQLSKAGCAGGSTFYRGGKNCFAPTGQTRMLPPIPELMKHISVESDVWLNAAPYASGRALS